MKKKDFSFSLELQGGRQDPAEALAGLPAAPGVYIFKDAAGEILYVGKAARLSDRVRSYTQTGDHDPKTRALVTRADSLEVILTGTEAEALLLEANLVRTYQPRYNIDLKDDKSFPYIKITRETFPRILFTRGRDRSDNAEYFGPYVSAGGIRSLVRHLRQTFFIRTCTGSEPGRFGSDSSPENGGTGCLNFHIERCKAPCSGYITVEDYTENIRMARAILSGRITPVFEELAGKMEEASRTLDFERAALLRDRIAALRKLTARQHVVGKPDEHFDAVAVEAAGDTAAAIVLEVREGRVLGRRGFILTRPGNEAPSELMSIFLRRRYLDHSYIPPKIYTSLPLADAVPLSALLAAQRGRPVEIRHPRRGEKKKLTGMASANAAMLIEERNRTIPRGTAAPVMEELRRLLDLPDPLHVIEAFDISNIQGVFAVGSMVVFRDGRPVKKGYRRYKIKTVDGPDDFAMMREVVLRRYRRLVREKEILPDLVLVDGGRGQLTAAMQALSKAGAAEGVRVAAIAKREELLYLPGRKEPVSLPAGSSALRLVQRIRDEAHRFAVTYHRKLRAKGAGSSALDGIPGVGPALRGRLLGRFASVAGIRRASIEEIAAVPGIGESLARRIRDSLR